MKLCVLIPAYNCGHVLSEVVARVPLGEGDEIIVVDDGSRDNTLEVARSLPRVHAVRNPVNRGYGGTSQRLYQLAVERGADLTVNIHGDLGHLPEDIPAVVAPLLAGACDLAVGSRLEYLLGIARTRGWTSLLSASRRRHMPLTRLAGHVTLTGLQNVCLGTNLHCFHEGMRACTRAVIDWIVSAEFTAWYNYDMDLLLRASRRGFRIHEVPVSPNYEGRAKSSAPPIRYGLRVLSFTFRAMCEGRRRRGPPGKGEGWCPGGER